MKLIRYKLLEGPWLKVNWINIKLLIFGQQNIGERFKNDMEG